MSKVARDWALTQLTGSSGTRHVLSELALAVSDTETTSKYGRAWPAHHAYLSIAALCERTLQDRKTVIANLRRLEDGGFIRRAGTDGATNQSVVYALPVGEQPPVPKTGPVPETEPVPLSPSTSTVLPSDQYRLSLSPVPKTGHEVERVDRKEKKKREHAPKREIPVRPSDVSEQVWSDWIALRTKKRATVTETVITEARKEAGKASLPFERFLAIWCMRGSQGLQAEWLKPSEQGTARTTPTRPNNFGELDYGEQP